MTDQLPPSSSPNWSSTTKLVVGLTLVAIVAALLIQFRSIIGPLILAFVLAYLMHPVSDFVGRVTHLSWRNSVNLVYLLLVVLLAGLITLSGFAAVQQVQSLISLLQRFVENLPDLINDLSTQIYIIGPFQLNFADLFANFNVEALTDQILTNIQALLGQMATLVTSFASSAALTLGWVLFILVTSYFLVTESNRISGEVVTIDIPGYTRDVRRLGNELRLIWNAFLRGQLIIIVLVVIMYTVLMMILGMRFAFGIAVLAGLGRFIPYLGPLIVWIVMALVAFFQTSNYFGLPPLQYTILVIVAGVILDQIFDNLVSPRFFGRTLGVHPAAVLVVAIIATNLIGIIGLLLAAPVLATLKIVGQYVIRKMLDLDPWPSERPTTPTDLPWGRSIRRLRAWLRVVQRR